MENIQKVVESKIQHIKTINDCNDKLFKLITGVNKDARPTDDLMQLIKENIELSLEITKEINELLNEE